MPSMGGGSGVDGGTIADQKLVAIDVKIAQVDQALADSAHTRIQVLTALDETLETRDVRRYASDAARQADVAPNGTWAMTVYPDGSAFYHHRESGAWVQRGGPLASAASVADVVRARVIEPEFFAVHSHHANYSQDNMLGDAGRFPRYRWVRLLEGGIGWRTLNPTQGTYNWAPLDTRVAWCEARGLKMMFCLDNAPNYATDGNRAGHPADPNNTAYNSLAPDPALAAAFLAEVVKRYAGRIHAYELWNEINLHFSWSGPRATVANAVQLANLCRQAVRTHDPAALVTTPNVTGDQGEDGPAYLDAMLTAGLTGMDAVSVHLYVHPRQPEAMLGLMRRYREVMQRHGIGALPVWDTEDTAAAYVDRYGQIKNTPFPSEAHAADWTVRKVLCAVMGGVDRHFQYGVTLGSDAFSMLALQTDQANGYALREGGRQLQVLHEQLSGATVVEASEEAGAYRLTIRTTRGETITYAWTGDYAGNRSTAPAAVSLGALATPAVAATSEVVQLTQRPTVTRRISRGASIIPERWDGENLLSNPDFADRAGSAGEPRAGWLKSGSATVTSYAGADAPTPDAMTVTSGQYGTLRALLPTHLRAGEYVIEALYRLDAGAEWVLALNAGRSALSRVYGSMQAITLSATGGWTWGRWIVTVTPELAGATEVYLSVQYNGTTSQALHLGEVRVRSERAPAAPPRRRRILHTFPTQGTFALGDEVLLRDTAAIATYGPSVTCTMEGTFGVLAGVTGTIASGSNLLTVAGGVLRPGEVVQLAGSALLYTVTVPVSAAQYRLNINADVALNAVAVSYVAPVFAGIVPSDVARKSLDNVFSGKTTLGGSAALGYLLEMKVFTRATLPSAGGRANHLTSVSNPEAGKGPLVIAYGNAWRYVSDDSLVTLA